MGFWQIIILVVAMIFNNSFWKYVAFIDCAHSRPQALLFSFCFRTCQHLFGSNSCFHAFVLNNQFFI